MYDRHLRGRFSGLSPKLLRHATCLYTVTPDFGFVVDRMPGSGRFIVASPCSGHGFKHSAAIGECVAAMALGATPPLDVTRFTLDRLRSPDTRPGGRG